ncbi:NACHT domain-containing protein [Marinibaculum pumilum]|uniref:NACHT domain-containing protein n=1 Tax=Marinibaculum pumilum TaxID=1766165 RepID=A0ABV7L2T8_9PROT
MITSRQAVKAKLKNSAGGAATAGGMNFQAAVTAIVNIHMARGRPLGWIPNQQDIPIAVDAETGGAGDDIACTLANGKRVEVQVKKGLTATNRLWSALLQLANGVSKNDCDTSVLVVCPNSSASVRDNLARDIGRIGSGRVDVLSDIGRKWLQELKHAGLDQAQTCQNLFVQTVPALANDHAAVQAAKAELGHICAVSSQIDQAWLALLNDASGLIEQRGRRSLTDIAEVLHAAGITVSTKFNTGPIGLLSKLAGWNHETNRSFSIFGVSKTLNVDSDWITLTAQPRAAQSMKAQQSFDLKSALDSYHNWQRTPSDEDKRGSGVNPETLGRFIRRGIVVAGPGMGKTTLLKRIARRYSEDSIPVLKMRLSAVAADMKNGASFEEAVFRHGLDGSGISADLFRSAGFSNLLLLGDGLDECGDMQEQIAEGISRFATGYPESRVLITTRPIGYSVNNFFDWRHYDLLPLDSSYAARSIAALWEAIAGSASADTNYRAVCNEELENKSVADAVGRTPLMIGVATAILANGQTLGRTRESLFDQVFLLVDKAPVRTVPKPASQVILSRFLELVGWLITRFPLMSERDMLELCGRKWAEISGESLLSSLEKSERYLSYWEDAGLLEKVGHSSTRVLCFVLKSFGEYLAARHLTNLADRSDLDEIRSALADAQWDNVLRFAGRLGLGELVTSLFFEQQERDSKWYLKLLDLVYIAAEAEPELSRETRARIFEDAFFVVAGRDQHGAFALGQPLGECARRYPNEVARHAIDLKDSGQYWSRIVAWNCLLKSGDFYAIEELQSVLQDSAEQIGTVLTPSLGGGVLFNHSNRHELGQSFVLEACVQLFNQAPRPVADDIIPKILNHKAFGSVAFLQKVEKLISAHKWPYRIEYDFGKYSVFDILKEPLEFSRAQTAADLFLLNALGADEVSVAVDVRPKSLLHLSAFVQVSNCWEMPVNDCWAWTRDFDPATAREVIRVIVELAGIDPVALRDDAIAAKGYILARQKEGNDQLWICRVYSLAEHIDHEEIDWSLARDIAFDEDLVEKALYHPSQWMVWMASNIVEARFDGARLQECIAHMCQRGSGYTLWAASCLLTELPEEIAVGMTIQRLKQKQVRGTQYLYSALCKFKIQMSVDLMQALENGLTSKNVKTAASAAELVEHLASRSFPEFMPLIKSHLEHWFKNEEPYPTKGGIIPDSPRARLIGAWLKIETPDFGQIRHWLGDDRSDVRDQGRQALKLWIALDRGHFAHYLDSVLEAELSPQTLNWLLSEGIDLSANDIKRVEGLLSHDKSAVRYNAMSILDPRYLGSSELSLHLRKLVDDPELQIQDRARSKWK